MADPETGGRYTVKLYSSEKIADAVDGWHHERITLLPDSDRNTFEPIVIEAGRSEDDFVVVAEMLTILHVPGV